MTVSIPASAIVAVNPGVIGTGGSPLAMNGVFVDQSTTIPIGKVLSFSSLSAVQSYFGLSSTQAALAATYFLGNDNSTIKPGTVFFAPYAASTRAAWIMGGTGLSLATVNALSAGTLTLSIDGTSKTTGSINLSGAASLSAAAGLIQTALQAVTGWTAITCTYNTTIGSFVITSGTSGASSSIGYASGTIATGLLLTQATGAVLSQGSAADTPATAMANVIANTTNWVSFATTFEPDTATKLLFAVWANAQNQRYVYIAWDSDATACTSSATSSFGYQVAALAYDGIFPVSGDPAYCIDQGTTLAAAALSVAAFVMGTVACIDFSRRNGRITAAFKSQSGLQSTVANEQKADYLIANGYNFYGKYATANNGFTFLYNGAVTGKWKWLDAFVDQVYMNNQFQLALMSLLTGVNSIPYNQAGYNLIRAALIDPINQMLNFGGIRAGITLSSQQAATLNMAAGVDISASIEQDGWYLQILDPGAQARGLRQTPVINFWYTDGGSVQKITMASVDIM